MTRPQFIQALPSHQKLIISLFDVLADVPSQKLAQAFEKPVSEIDVLLSNLVTEYVRIEASISANVCESCD